MIQASSGVEALALFGCHVFDLVFMDLSMPGMTGVECFFELKKKYPDAQVVMTTGYCDDRELLKASGNGLYGVLQNRLISLI